MLSSLTIAIIASIFLFLINLIQKKQNFLLDKISINEKHKVLLITRNKIPLSGIFYFLPVISSLTFSYNIYLSFICGLIFCIGFMSDSKFSSSPKVRLILQLFVILIFLFLNKELTIDTRINFLNNLLQKEFFRIVIISFFFLVLINGFNFIDGVNNLCSLNFLIILIFLFIFSKDQKLLILSNEIFTLIIFLFVFVLYNFFGKNFLGDGGVYGLGFFIGYLCIIYASLDDSISPYFIANLLWYPAFENLFSIIRRTLSKRKNYLPDNKHLHQLLFIFLKNKKWIKKKYLLSSFVGILINLYLLIGYYIGYTNHSETYFQIILIFINITIYLFIYYKLENSKDV